MWHVGRVFAREGTTEFLIYSRAPGVVKSNEPTINSLFLFKSLLLDCKKWIPLLIRLGS